MGAPTGPKLKERVDLETLLTRAQDRLREKPRKLRRQFGWRWPDGGRWFAWGWVPPASRWKVYRIGPINYIIEMWRP